MEISKDENIFAILEKQVDLIKEDNTEWIIDIYNQEDNVWTEMEFNNFTSVMRTLGFEEIIGKQYLEVSNGEDILKILNTPNITKYCVSDTHERLLHEWVKKKEITSEIVDNLFNANVKIGVYKTTENVEPENWEDIRKKYKIVIPISYKDHKNTIFRVNIVKYNDDEFYTLKQSGIIKEKQKYEFQLIIEDKEVVLQSIIKMLQSISLSTLLLSKPQQKVILEEYHNLIKGDILVKEYNRGEIPLLAPKPVTLERTNMIDPTEYGAISILSEYTVTEKADGERILMFINKQGKVYLINNNYVIEDTGIKASKELYNSLIDGEYIACNKRKDISNKALYASFDIYYVNGKKITNLPLIDKKNSRYDYLQKTKNLLNDKDGAVEYISKTHYYSDTPYEIYKFNKMILNNKDYPYEIDGLIFTPAKLAIYSYYSNKPVQITDNVKWDRVFKWKPPEQNTIDFLVKEGKEVVKNGQRFKELELYVGYNASQWEEISPSEGLKIRYDWEANKLYKNKRKDYVPKLFKPTIEYTPGVEIAYMKTNNKGDMRALNGDIIETGSIVEFSYNNDKDISVHYRWQPLRVREDKTRLYKSGKLSKTANELGVAINVWRSIHLPVTEAMIVNNAPVFSKDAPVDIEERLLDTDDIYYAREIPRDSLLSVNMLNFHNQCIKKDLYMKSSKKGSILELACGQAGDMNRWIDAGYNFILGVDLVKNNIYNPRYGAYSRMIKRHNQYRRKEDNDRSKYIDMVFAVGDCGIPIKDGTAAKVLDDDDSAKILRIVLNKQGNVSPIYKHIAGKGAFGFDVVSCMFAIHYFFESEERLDGFLSNVSSNLKKGGIFICTFMDGKAVEELLDGTDYFEGRKNTSSDILSKSVPVWAIIRRFKKDMESKYSKKIDVYIENTQKLIPEFLVNYELLIEKAKLFNLILHETEMFGQTFNKKLSEVPEDVAARDRTHENILLLNDDPIQKEFSFLNRWLVLKKK